MEVEVILEYQGKQYKYVYDFGEGYPYESAEFMYTEGNYSCDCNRSIFIQEHCDNDFPEMECGEEIKLVSLKQIL